MKGKIKMTTFGKTTQFLKTYPKALKAGNFLWHLLQMILVMEAGMMVYHKLIMPLLMPLGFHALMRANPLYGYWIMVASMTLPMIALMRWFHKSSWRYTLEMTAFMLAPLAALSLLVACNLCSFQVLQGFGDPLMYLAMTAFLLLRPAQHNHGGQVQACHAG
jgi:hypothetical protein